MNQILSMNGGMEESRRPQKNRKGNGGPAKISTVIIFFVICIVIFGVVIAGWAVYNKFIDNSAYDANATIAQITHKLISENVLEITIEHDKELETIEYSWNGEETEVIEIDGQTYTGELEIPSGVNTLNLVVTDEKGMQTNLDQKFEVSEVIKFEVVNGDMKITVNSSVEIEAMAYQWNDETQVAFEVGDNVVERLISIPKGLNNLTVRIVDVNGVLTEKEQLVEGVMKPVIKPSINEAKTNIVFSLSDEVGLKGIHITINGEKEYSYTFSGELEGTYELPVVDLYEGSNQIVVTVTNTKDISTETTINVNN